LGHPLCGNIREGTWLASYIVNRLRRVDELQKLADQFERAFEPLNAMPHFLRPCYFELVFSYLYNAIEEVLVEKLE
jgi:glycogen debranching enzyme